MHIMSDANENSRFTALKQLFPIAEYSILKHNFILRCQIDVSAKKRIVENLQMYRRYKLQTVFRRILTTARESSPETLSRYINDKRE